MKLTGLLAKLSAASAPAKVAVAIGATATVVGGGTAVYNVANGNSPFSNPFADVTLNNKESENKGQFVLLETEKTIEIGTLLSENINDYVNLNKTDSELLENAKLNFEGVVFLENGFPKPGEHKIVITAGDKEYEIKLNVKDTKPPVFKDGLAIIETKFGQKPEYAKIFFAEDSSGVTITVDDSKVDYEKTGTYNIVVTAKDGYGNESTLNPQVKVLEEEKKKEESTTNKGSSSSSYSDKGSSSTNSNTSSSSSSNTSTKPSGNSGSTSSSGSNSSGSSSDVKEECKHTKTKVVNKKDATCTETGYTGDTVCSSCNTVIKQGSSIAKLGHDYKDGKCTRCGTKDPNYKEEKPNNFPYKAYTLMYYNYNGNKYYGFFKPAGDGTGDESLLIAQLLPPEGGETDFFEIQFDDGWYIFFYNVNNPYAPSRP